MHTEYADITSRLGEPLWWDDVCAPRYEPFQPYLCNDIYADEAMLIEIRCQACGHRFYVAAVWDPYDGGRRLSTFAEHGRAEWGDPPAHGCMGDTMTSESVRIVEFWKRSPVPLGGWERKTECEKPTPSWWLGGGEGMTGYTLTEIEEGAQVLTNTTGACNPESVILLPSAHYHWLLARVRELEAQAALDATVVEAIGPYREVDSAVTRAYNRYVASKGTSEEAVAEFDLNWTRGVFVGYERVLDDALDAALAARKGMT